MQWKECCKLTRSDRHIETLFRFLSTISALPSHHWLNFTRNGLVIGVASTAFINIWKDSLEEEFLFIELFVSFVLGSISIPFLFKVLSEMSSEDGGENSKEWPTVIFLTKQIVLQNRIRENLGYLKIFTFYSIRLWTC